MLVTRPFTGGGGVEWRKTNISVRDWELRWESENERKFRKVRVVSWHKLTELGYETGMCEQVEQPLVVFS